MTDTVPTAEQRCRSNRTTHAFVVADTVDALGEKMLGIVGDRRMTKMHRYLTVTNTPRLSAGLRIARNEFGNAVLRLDRRAVSISLTGNGRLLEGIGFSVGPEEETEEQAAMRFHSPHDQWLGQRRDITLVDLTGWPGSPSHEDSIRIESWNSQGIGQETIVVFDDVDPVQEIAWTLKGDTERSVYLDNEFCTIHQQHYEDPIHTHQHQGCDLRTATLAENLRMLADRAERETTL
jgi:hypothetical protein